LIPLPLLAAVIVFYFFLISQLLSSLLAANRDFAVFVEIPLRASLADKMQNYFYDVVDNVWL